MPKTFIPPKTKKIWMAKGELSKYIKMRYVDHTRPKDVWVYQKGDSLFQVKTKSAWLLDNRCSRHMNGYKRILRHITPCKKDPIIFTYNSTNTMIGKGMVRNVINQFLKNVYLVDGLSYNLISISELCDIGCDIKFEKYECTIRNFDKTILARNKRVHNNFSSKFN